MQAKYFWLSLVMIIFLIVVCAFVLVPRLSIELVEPYCKTCTEHDSLSIAMQLGRLDVVSLCLAVIGIGVGFFAVFSYLAIREDARKTAEGVAKDTATNEANSVVQSWLVDEEMTKLVERAVAKQLKGTKETGRDAQAASQGVQRKEITEDKLQNDGETET